MRNAELKERDTIHPHAPQALQSRERDVAGVVRGGVRAVGAELLARLFIRLQPRRAATWVLGGVVGAVLRLHPARHTTERVVGPLLSRGNAVSHDAAQRLQVGYL